MSLGRGPGRHAGVPTRPSSRDPPRPRTCAGRSHLDSGQPRNQNWLYFGRIDHPAGSQALKQQLYIRLRYGEAAFAAAELAATRNLRRDITRGVNDDPANFDIAVLGIETDETPRAPVPADVILAHQIRTA